MKRILVVAALLLSTIPFTVAAENGPGLPAWMTGAWFNEAGETWADEYWTPPRAGIMIGASRSGKADKLSFWEHMRIIREPDGKLAFWAIAGDQKPVRFAVVKNTAEEIIFENSDNDYPQRVRYWREGKMLKAEISLVDGSKASNFSFGRPSSGE
jgi:hypothetical protein